MDGPVCLTNYCNPSPGFYELPESVRKFTERRFDPLEAQYTAQSALDANAPDFLSFLEGGQRQPLGGDDWQNVLQQLGGQFGGIGLTAGGGRA